MSHDRPTVLVTGGCGYIGSHAVLALRDAGRPVVVLDDLSAGTPAALPSDVLLVRGSTGDGALLARTLAHHRVGAVMHFAASLIVPDSLRRPLDYWRNNVANTAVLVDACVRAGIDRIVFSSTAAVYGDAAGGVVDENAPTVPINPYGSSKLAAERMLADAATAHGLRPMVLRYFNVAGADERGRAGPRHAGATHLITVACEAASRRREQLTIYGTDYPTADGTCVRDYIHVSDLADAHVLALEHLGRGGDGAVLNCGYGAGHSVRDVVAAIEREAGRRLPVVEAPRRPGDPPRLVARPGRLGALLGWRPRYASLDAIVGSALAWERRTRVVAALPALRTRAAGGRS